VNKQPRNFIILASLMLPAGVVLPLLMIVGEMESTFLTNFVSYAVSAVGLFLGIIGIAMWVGDERNSRDRDDWPDL
jgi:hypothetical protein